MPGFNLDWLLYTSFGLMAIGDLGATFYYWFNLEYKLAGVFICYGIASVIFMTITGVK
jgi:hypothetical protein